MKCPYCGEELKEWDRRLYCENMACSANHEDLPQFIWQDLIAGKKAQSEINYYKGLNCPSVVEKQMQTITELAKRLEAAQNALKAIHSTLSLDKSDEDLDKMMILPTGLHVIKHIINQGLEQQNQYGEKQ